MKKVVSLLLVLMMLLSTSVVTASAAYENTYTNTGNQRVDILGVAKTQVGNTNGLKYRSDGASWCASFIVWCARQANIDSSIIKNTGWATADDLGITYYGRNADRTNTITYTPKAGDVIIFDWSSNGYCYKSPPSFYGDHVGLVEYVENGYVHTIEGNSGSPGAVRRKSYSLSSSEIKGYGVPAYENTEQERQSVITTWAAPVGKEAPILSEGLVNTQYQFWYRMLDKNTGDLYNSYSNTNYSATIYVYNPDGSVLFSNNYGRSDNNWIRCTPTKVGTYKITVKVTGNIEAGYTREFKVTSDGKVVMSPSTLNLNLASKPSGTVNISLSGNWPDDAVYEFSKSNNNIQYTQNGSVLTVTGVKTGSTDLKIKIYAKESGTALAEFTTKVNVNTNTLKIYYNANGGSISSDTYKLSSNLIYNKSDSSKYFQSWVYNETKTNGLINASTFGIYKTGYTFNGWGTTSSGGTVFGQGDNTLKPTDFNANIKNGDCSTTLYAQWKANTYTVKYNANGGSGTMSNSSHTYDVSKALTSNAFTRSGYTFRGWSTSSSATSPTYTNGQSVKNLTSTNDGTVTLYAVWSKNPTYTLSYNANGGSGAPSSQTGSSSYTISSTVPTRTGYTFLGWSTSSSSTSATYQPGSSITISTNTTLYAVWKNGSTALTVNSSHNAVISTAGEKKYYTFTPSESGTYVIYSTGSSDTKVYLYNSSGGELTSNDDGGTGGNFRLQYNLTAGTTYRFAVGYYSSSATGTIPFKFGKVYTVTYNSNGGSSAPSSQTKDYGISLTLSSAIPTRTDYTFLGWSTSSSATSPTYSAGGTYSSESNATLYAVWKVNPKATYTVTYNANGGNVTPSSTSVTEGNSVTLPTPTKSYTLSFNANGGSGAPSAQTVSVGCKGWSTSSVASSGTFSCNATVYPTANTTFYAVWNSSASKVIPSTVPTRSGYNFIGWSRSSLATTATWKAGDAITVTDNTTLYAVWQKIETPTPPPAPKVEYKSVYLDYKSTYSIDVEGFEATEYITEDDSIVSVDSNGRVTAKRPGTADVYVYDANSDVRVVYTFSVDYAWWQWIIIIVLFGWIWY